jgi:hypothetical protein
VYITRGREKQSSARQHIKRTAQHKTCQLKAADWVPRQSSLHPAGLSHTQLKIGTGRQKRLAHPAICGVHILTRKHSQQTILAATYGTRRQTQKTSHHKHNAKQKIAPVCALAHWRGQCVQRQPACAHLQLRHILARQCALRVAGWCCCCHQQGRGQALLGPQRGVGHAACAKKRQVPHNSEPHK